MQLADSDMKQIRFDKLIEGTLPQGQCPLILPALENSSTRLAWDKRNLGFFHLPDRRTEGPSKKQCVCVCAFFLDDLAGRGGGGFNQR